jgi:hypothetical protein
MARHAGAMIFRTPRADSGAYTDDPLRRCAPSVDSVLPGGPTR